MARRVNEMGARSNSVCSSTGEHVTMRFPSMLSCGASDTPKDGIESASVCTTMSPKTDAHLATFRRAGMACHAGKAAARLLAHKAWPGLFEASITPFKAVFSRN